MHQKMAHEGQKEEGHGLGRMSPSSHSLETMPSGLPASGRLAYVQEDLVSQTHHHRPPVSHLPPNWDRDLVSVLFVLDPTLFTRPGAVTEGAMELKTSP